MFGTDFLRTNFLKSLVLVSVAAVLVIPVYIILSLSPSISSFFVEIVERDAERIAKHLAAVYAKDDAVISRDTLPATIEEESNMILRDFNLQKIKIYAANGEIIFSTDPKDIGKFIKTGYFFRIVSKGVPYSSAVKKDSKSLEGEVVHRDVVETYVPVMHKGKFLGAFEVYADITEQKERFHSILKSFYTTLFLIVMGLLTALIVSVFNAKRIMSERAKAEEKIVAQSVDLRKMNTELSVLYEISQKRQEEVLAAQGEKLAALEKVQEEMAKAKEMRLDFLRHTVKSQEDERARIARELHDETAQVLTAASLNMEALKKYVVDHPEAEELIMRAKNLCRQMSQGLYRLVHDLRPAQLDDLGLVPALEHLVEDSGGCGETMKIDLKISGDQRRLDPFVETVLYRAAQEALTNASKYAKTDEAAVHLHFNQEQVVLRVRDKGVGFDPEAHEYESPSGWGLAGIRERVDSVSGQLLVQSSPGAGTLIEIVVPIDNMKH